VPRSAKRSVFLTGVLLGVGIVGALDEAIFHQILQWHTFYWSDSEGQRILSDGLFHLLTLAVLVYAIVRVWQTSTTLHGHRAALIGAILVGAGGFNLYDGLVQHALLHLHLVNEYVCANPMANNSLATCAPDIPYELAWGAMALALLAAGAVRWRSAVWTHANDAAPRRSSEGGETSLGPHPHAR